MVTLRARDGAECCRLPGTGAPPSRRPERIAVVAAGSCRAAADHSFPAAVSADRYACARRGVATGSRRRKLDVEHALPAAGGSGRA